jgi:hypothetical protein
MNLKNLILLEKIVIACLGFFSIFKISELVIATNYGIADKDEGFYLLAADPPNNSAAWAFPWGWSTKFIFEFTNFDLSTFRAVGAAILIFTSLFFVREIFQFQHNAVSDSLMSDRLKNLSILMLGLSFAVIFYGSFVYRTPGYNWVNYVGILLSCTGLMKQLNRHSTDEQNARNSIAAALFAAGLFFSTPAKPSTPIFLMLISILFLLLDKRSVKKWIIISISYYGIFVSLALILRVWPINFISILVRAFQSPVVDNDQSVIGALLNILKTPSYVSGNIRSSLLIVNISLFTTLLLLIFFLKRNRFASLYYLYPLFLVCVFLNSGISFQSIYFLQTSNTTLSIWKLSTALLILLTTNVIILWISYPSSMRKLGTLDRRIFFPILLCIAIPFISSFGSAHGILNMGSFSSASLVLATILLSSLILNPKIRIFLIRSNLAFALCLSLTVSIQSYQHPWNISPTTENTEILTFGKHEDQIYVDKEFAREFDELRRNLIASGWRNNQPLLGVNWHIASTIPYLLGARPPNSLMLTIYGYDNSMDVLNYNLGIKYNPYPYGEAWIMTTPLNQLPPSEKIEVQSALDALETKTFREFPSDYSFVTQSQGIEFWKPKG